jgi:2-polyprenyl-6-methoxyphenol hydroxylase-like FAD-dependent oxidoreductase
VRPHTPHGAHVHILLAGGLVSLCRLVPKLPGWLDEMGMPEGDLTHHARVAFEGRWLPRARSGIPIRTCTRSTVEHLLRRNVGERTNVRVLDDCKVEGLVGRGRVRGARVSRGGTEEELAADLVVDATGRSSPTSRWLEEAGVREVEELTVDAGVTYASAWFDPPAEIADDWTLLATLPSIPRDVRMGVAIRFGPGRMLCSSIAYGRQKSPQTHEELVAGMADLPAPQLHRLMRASKPTSDIVVYGNTQNRWRRYGRLPWFPDGLVVLGDAVCSLNPRYGQGMTVAAMSAEQLEQELAAQLATGKGLDGFSHRFQKSLERVLTVPWQIALMEDQAWVTTLSGAPPTLGQRIALAGSQRVLKTAFTDIDTYIRFMRVAQLLDAPTKMLAPRTLAKIAAGPGRGGGSEQDHAPAVGAA